MIPLLALAVVLAQAAAGASQDEFAAKAERGKQAMAAGRFEEAAALYREIVRALPSEPGMLMNLGLAEAMSGRHREAIPHLRAAVKLQPGLLPGWLFLGAAHMELGEPARAVEPLQKVLAAEPANDQARQMLADALLALGRHEGALRQFARLAERAPDSARAWYGLGRSYEGLSRAALAELQRSSPESAYVLILTAEMLEAQGRHANAFRLYREALEKLPGLPDLHEAIAEIYEKTGHADWAAAEREKAKAVPARDCQKQPGFECDFRAGGVEAVLAAASKLRTAESRYWTARAAHELGRSAFLRLGKLPESPEAALFRADVLRGQGRPLEAAAELQRAVPSWPEDGRLRRELATSLHLGRDFEAARPLLEELVQQEPGSPLLAYLLGDVYVQLRQADKAIPVLESALKQDAALLPARAALGRAYLEAGQAARALPHLEAATATDEDGSLHYQLARANQAAGHAAKAQAALEKYQRMRADAEARAKNLEQEFQITAPRR